MPKVSVCVQAYNHASYIAQALDSVLMQETDFDFELIIGEDESSDGTREICIRYAEQHPDRIRLFLRSREDVIYINGRATGRYNFVENLRAARGEYIALLARPTVLILSSIIGSVQTALFRTPSLPLKAVLGSEGIINSLVSPDATSVARSEPDFASSIK